MPRHSRSTARHATPLRACAWAVAAGAGLTLTGCVDNSADAVELSNMRPWKKVPLASPAAFTGSFARYCAAPLESGESFATVLRQASFVPVSKESGSGSRVWLMDDTRPAVLVNEGPKGRSCGVVALARSGQTQRVEAAIPRLFPEARAADPALAPGAERV